MVQPSKQTPHPDINFAIIEIKHSVLKPGQYTHGATICDSDTKEDVIEKARHWLQQQAFEAGEYGAGSEEVILWMIDESDWHSTKMTYEDEEVITISWEGDYHNGRISDQAFDYGVAIGSIRTI